VPHNSLARRFGFRRGDVLLEINGQAVADSAGLEGLLLTSSDRWTVVFRRKGRVRKVELSA